MILSTLLPREVLLLPLQGQDVFNGLKRFLNLSSFLISPKSLKETKGKHISLATWSIDSSKVLLAVLRKMIEIIMERREWIWQELFLVVFSDKSLENALMI